MIKNDCFEKHVQDKWVAGSKVVLWVGSNIPINEVKAEDSTEIILQATHVPLLYLRPWRPTFFKLQPRFAAQELVEVMRSPELQAEDAIAQQFLGQHKFEFEIPKWRGMEESPFMTHFAFLSTLDPQLYWSMLILELSQSNGPYPLSSGRVRANLSSKEPVPVWPHDAEQAQREEVWINADEDLEVEEEAGAEQLPLEGNEVDNEGADVVDDAGDIEPLLQRAEHLVAEGNQEDSSSSSSSSSETDIEEAREGVAVAEPAAELAEAEAVPRARNPDARRAVHDATFTWGSFLFTHRGEGSTTAWQCTCRYHSGRDSASRCTKTRGFKNEAESAEVIRKLKSWALSAPAFASKQEHQGGRGLPAMAPEHRGLDDAALDALLMQLPPLP